MSAKQKFLGMEVWEAKVREWLTHIGEFDKPTIDEVLDNCRKDSEAMAYFLKRYNEDCKGATA